MPGQVCPSVPRVYVYRGLGRGCTDRSVEAAAALEDPYLGQEKARCDTMP
jgi:hypothetical protein